MNTDKPDKSSLRITFHGPAVEDGEIDIAVLGPSLTSLDGFLKLSRQAVDDPDKQPVSIRLSATSKKHSLLLDLSIDPVQVIQQIEHLPETIQLIEPWLRENWNTIADLWEEHKPLARQVVRIVRGLVSLARSHGTGKLMPLRTRSQRRRKNTNIYVTPGGDRIFLEIDIDAVLRNRNVKPKLLGFLKPVELDGIDRIVLKSGEESVEVTAEDVHNYRYLRFPAETHERRSRETLTVLSPHFQRNRQWRLRGRAGDESTVFSARMKDELFMGRVVRREVEFGYRDKIDVTLITQMPVPIVPPGKKRYEKYDIEKVHNHIKGPAPNAPTSEK